MWDKVFPYAYAFCEAFLSADHHISDAGNVSSFLFSISISCFVIGLFLLEIWFREPAWYFEGLESIGRHPASFWCGLGVIVLAFLPFSVLHQPEGIMEVMTALLLIGSGLVTVFLTAKYQETDRWRVLGVGLVFVFLGMEEISWGQHLFGWQTPEAFAVLNDQSETNLHNLNNKLLLPFCIFAALTISVVLALGNSTDRSHWRFVRFVDPPQFIGFIPWLLFSLLFNLPIASHLLVRDGGEVLESLGSVMAVFFAIHIWRTRGVSSP